MTDSIVLSSRVRLARNFADMPFPSRQNEIWAAEAVRRVSEAVAAAPDGRRFRLLRLSDMTDIERMALVEKHLISLDLLKKTDTAAVLLRDDERVSVMVGEEDHVRIQGLTSGMALQEAADLSDGVDDAIDERAAYAFDEQIGYLTACPTNAGTGLRASVMLHLPALSMAGQMGGIAQASGKVGLTVRGLYGEGSEALGCLYQLSNQITLGRTEEDIRLGLASAAAQVIDREKQMRVYLMERSRLPVSDRVMRSVGTLLFSRQLPTAEFMRLWSDALLASDLGLWAKDAQPILATLVHAQPGMLQMQAGGPIPAEDRDEMRAAYVRRALG